MHFKRNLKSLRKIVREHDKKSKPKNYAFEGYQNQVRAYCFLLRENFKYKLGNKKIYGLLRCYKDNRIFWREAFDEMAEGKIQDLLRKIRDIKTEKIKPEKAKNKNCCQNCRYSDFCSKV